jgi:hypothetical protein
MNLKVEGVLAGVSDLIILTPNAKAIFLEMKDADGKVSKVQHDFINQTKALGFTALVAYSAESALEQLRGLQ